jgi:type IV secretion system protein TrbI
VTDPIPPAPITDTRPRPRLVIPRHAKIWLLGGGSAGLVLLSVIFGGEDAQRTAALMTPQTAPANPDIPRTVRERLEKLPVAQPTLPPDPVALTVADPLRGPYVDTRYADQAAQKPADPIAEDRKRREYESLFSSNVVLSRRPDSERLAAPPAQQPAGAVQPPSLDEIARSVMRASGSPLPAREAPPVTAAGLAPLETRAGAAASAPAAGALKVGLHRIFEGSIIDAVLTNRLDGESDAPVNCLVTNDIFAHDGTLVIPSGARVLGRASRVESFGETRLAVSFHRLILPDGRSVSLDSALGMNQVGDLGLKDKRDSHMLAAFGASAAVGIINGLGQALGSVGRGDGSTVIVSGVGDSTQQASSQVLARFLNRLPTITIREGHRVKVYLTSDLDLAAYNN